MLTFVMNVKTVLLALKTANTLSGGKIMITWLFLLFAFSVSVMFVTLIAVVNSVGENLKKKLLKVSLSDKCVMSEHLTVAVLLR